MTNLLPGKRYILRELLPRAVLLTLTFGWIMPLMTGLFAFTGGWISAALFGTLFTAMFCLLGAYLPNWEPVSNFLQRHADKWWLPIVHVAVIVLLPAAALSLAALLAPSIFTLNWLYGPWAGTLILNLACAATHDYSGGESTAPGND